MDQDFHYYGTYYAARVGGNHSQEDATIIAKASNFIDFLSNEKYAGYWHMVKDTEKNPDGKYEVVAEVDYPRYTFQGTLSAGVSGSSGLWSSFHFLPGNYKDPSNASTHIDVHGKSVTELLPGHQIREIKPESSLEKKINPDIGQLLNRPQSALSRALIKDTIDCIKDPKRLVAILERAAGGKVLLENLESKDVLKRFGLLLLGIRAHVIADTWAHQDWCGVDNVINTYYDIENKWGRQAIKYQYQDSDDWQKVVLSSMNMMPWVGNENLTAVPNKTSYLGHGWMGHLPDYSFIKYRYKPSWRKTNDESLERDNPTEYKHAFLELCSLFSQAKANGSKFQPQNCEKKLEGAEKAISSSVDIKDKSNCPREYSSNKWKEEMDKVEIKAPKNIIDAKLEPDEKTVLSGQIDYNGWDKTRYGTLYINIESDLYLFQIAADYQFHFVKQWTKTHKIGPSDLFLGSWSKQLGPLSKSIEEILF